MNPRLVPLACACAQLFVTAPMSPAQAEPGRPGPALARLQTGFVANRGQWDTAAEFVAERREMLARFEPDAIVLQLLHERTDGRMRGHVVRLELPATDRTELAGRSALPRRHSYLTGGASSWRTDVPVFGQLVYRSLTPGVDLVVREQAGMLEYDVMLERHAALDDVVINCRGVESVSIRADGALVLDTGAGELVQPAPTTWQVTADGQKQPIECRFRKIGATAFGFLAPERDPRNRLVVDPALQWSTFVGGTSYEYTNSLDVGSDGSVYVAGATTTAMFPVSTGAFDVTYNGAYDAFVAKLDASGSRIVYATFLGGGLNDYAHDIAVDSRGELTVLGFTRSMNFPVSTRAYQRRNLGGFGEVFVTRLNAAGSGVVYSTYLGGSDYDWPGDVAVDASGNATVVGWTKSTNFPTTTGAFSRTYKTKGDGFVTRLDATGARLVFSTYLGSDGWDELNAVRVDSRGAVTIAGTVWVDANGGSTFPTTRGAFDQTFNGGTADAFVAQLDARGASLAYSTFVGGKDLDYGLDVALDKNGAAVFGGRTHSSDFPTTSGSFDRSLGSTADAFVSRLDGSGGKLTSSTFLGGSGRERVTGVTVDSADHPVVVGFGNSADFPTTSDAVQRTFKGGTSDCFLTRLDPALGTVKYSTLFGDSQYDAASSVALGSDDAATFGGETFSAGLRTTASALDRTYNGTGDGFVTRISLRDSHTHGTFTAFGTGCPGTNARVPSHTGLGHPDVGMTFTWALRNARPVAPTVFLLGGVRVRIDLTALGMNGCFLYLQSLVTVATVTSATGGFDLPFPLPSDVKLVGARVVTQYAVVDIGATTTVPIVWTNGLETTVGGNR